MFRERYPGQGPNFQQPQGPFRQQQRPNFQRMPQVNRPFSQGPQQSRMGGQFRGNGPMQQPSNNKGLLGKLFGRSKQSPPNLFAPPSGMKSEPRSSGGILDTLKRPGGLNSMLNNTQRVLQAAEQFTPMIQQYGPIVKNLPSLWKIMRAFNSSDNTNDTKNEETKTIPTKTKTTVKKQQESSDSVIEENPPPRKQKRKSESVPKLYI